MRAIMLVGLALGAAATWTGSQTGGEALIAGWLGCIWCELYSMNMREESGK